MLQKNGKLREGKYLQDVNKMSWGGSERSQCKCLLQQAEADVLWEDQNGEDPKIDLLRPGESPAAAGSKWTGSTPLERSRWVVHKVTNKGPDMGLHQMLHMPKTNIKKGWWGGIRTGKDHSAVTITGKTEQLWCTPGTQTGSTHHRSIIALVIKRNFAPQIKNLMCRKRKKILPVFFWCLFVMA